MCLPKCYFLIYIIITYSFAHSIYESDINFRVEPGSRSCFYEAARAGQMMEVYYQVLDGQHGDLDISFDVMDPNGVKIVSDYKKPENSIIIDLEVDGDFAFCLDNTYSVMNSKLVFIYVLIEDQHEQEGDEETEVTVISDNGDEQKEEEVLEWAGVDENGQMYYIEVRHIADSMSRTLQQVLKARRLLDKYGATKSRDSYMAFEDTFLVDVWSAFQISFMVLVGMLQVYMIKQLFNRSHGGIKSMY